MIINIASFEIRKLLSTHTAWIILAITQLLLSILFFKLLSEFLAQPTKFAGQGLTEIVVSAYYQFTGIFFILLTPFLTMRLISEELRSGTIRLLFSSPVTIREVILGKYFAILLFMFCILALISIIPASLTVGTTLDYGHFFSCILGLALLISALISVGLFISTLFRHLILAGVSSFGILTLLWTAHLAGTNNALLNTIFNYLSLQKHYLSFTSGIFNTTDFFYFIIVFLLFVTLSIWRLDSMRTHHW